MSNRSININGNVINTSFITGDNVVVSNGRRSVFINNTEVATGLEGVVELKIEGYIVSVNSEASVRCGDVHGDVKCEGSVRCGNVTGQVSCDGSITAERVEGNVTVDGSASISGGVGGSVKAGGSLIVNK